MNKVFGLDIGTRNVVGTVGYRTDDGRFNVIAQYVRQHQTRAMLDGQIHDIGRVGKTINLVKEELEAQIGEPLTDVCIAAAGRVLKTVTTHVEHEYPEESVVTGEDLHTLHLLGVENAHNMIRENNDTSYRFYSVGYSTIKYFLNDEEYISIEGHKADKISEDIIVTFLPEDVVDGLYSAVGIAGLSVANLTLEPIAAINVAIPENYRMLNLALVDVGAGTSDISITREGSIIAYGMIPYAGDELTELIVQNYLVDFATAESIKLASTTEDEISYEDIMNILHTVPAREVWELLEPVVEKITTEVAGKIRELNGNKTVSACFVVGGGGKVHGFTDKLAEKLGLPIERVALRGEEVLGEVNFEQEEIKKDPLLVTPIGICLNYYEQKNNFIMVRFNGERLKLYDNNHLTIVDAAMQAGFPNDRLFPKRGEAINFTVNGAARIARGDVGEAAVVTMNGQPAHINTPLEANAEITITPSTEGEAASCTVAQLDEYQSASISFIINGKKVTCQKFVEVNGSLEPDFYEIKEGDHIETRSFYTVSQVAEFMDVAVDFDYPILVNNRPANLNTLVYENFSIDWTVNGLVPAVNTERADHAEAESLAEPDYDIQSETKAYENEPAVSEYTDALTAQNFESVTEETAHVEEPTAPVYESEPVYENEPVYESEPQDAEYGKSDSNAAPYESEQESPAYAEALTAQTYDSAETLEAANEIPVQPKPKVQPHLGQQALIQQHEVQIQPTPEPIPEPEPQPAPIPEPAPVPEPQPAPAPQPVPEPTPAPEPVDETAVTVYVNGDAVTLSGKDSYIFVDVFDRITFDLNSGQGRAIITKINGKDAGFIQPIYNGDKIEIYWKEK